MINFTKNIKIVSNVIDRVKWNLPETGAYIHELLTKLSPENVIDPHTSIVILHAKAKCSGLFVEYQSLADGLFIRELFATLLKTEMQNAKNPSDGLGVEIAKRSYWSCYRSMQPAWPLFAELSDRFPELPARVGEELRTELQVNVPILCG